MAVCEPEGLIILCRCMVLKKTSHSCMVVAESATARRRPSIQYLGQWRRQTIKSGSAFKGQLYFQVGQMEGPKFPNDSREARSVGAPKELCLGRGAVTPATGLWVTPQKKKLKINFEVACFLHFRKLKTVSPAVWARLSIIIIIGF